VRDCRMQPSPDLLQSYAASHAGLLLFVIPIVLSAALLEWFFREKPSACCGNWWEIQFPPLIPPIVDSEPVSREQLLQMGWDGCPRAASAPRGVKIASETATRNV
jgi:hypothetical protein